MKAKKRILYCVLNWGLGHATRSVPLIDKLLKEENEIVIASDGKSMVFLQQQFPQLNFIQLPKFNICYPSKYAVINGIYIFFKVLSLVLNDRKAIKVFLKHNDVDLIISDNRFGCWSKKIKTIYITHQVLVKFPGIFKVFEKIGFWFHAAIINKYDECWIPDFEGEINVSGDLSHKYKLKTPTKYIGLLSRFAKPTEAIDYKYDYCIVISGPEPQRTQFEKIVLEKFVGMNKKVVVMLGDPGNETHYAFSNIEVHNHLKTREFQEKVMQSKYIICRSGYSSIMDLVSINRTALLVPTPGQTEQEYLASYLLEAGLFKSLSQKSFAATKPEDLPKV